MDARRPDEFGGLPPTQAWRVDAVCQRFEAEWRAGHEPRIEDFLAEADQPQRLVLFRELLALELELRQGRGERPDPREYRTRFPDHTAAIAAGFSRETAASADGGSTFTEVTAPRPLAEVPGFRIGPYKLSQKIGEGGMGVVYMAEQEAPVRRRVALKIIKPGLGTGQVIARFEAERQALSLMDHPHIAKVFDAGSTDTDRPYFVMELVQGLPITDYCDQARLTPAERLELFIPVSQAIQHAHQKGIIHRDLKPSNVLVALYDGRPVPKVIDFGLAKAIDQRLTERTMFTQFGQIIGTLEYMSPEQAEIGALDIDTRSDIYSLGVVLYELLTGSTPLERRKLREAACSEILRRIREEEPPRPSKRLSTTEELTSIAAQRRTDPARLSKVVRGDLDWIVMKALERDRTRRYETTNGFTRDIQRFLEGDPVEAGPPSAAYKLRKLARKHRAALVTAGAFALLLVGASVVSSYLAYRAQQAEGLALRRLIGVERANEILGSIFRDLDPRAEEREDKLLRVQLGERLDRVAEQLDAEAIDDPLTVAKLQNTLGVTQFNLGSADKAIALLTRSRETREKQLGPDHRDTLTSRNDLAEAYRAAGRMAEAIALHEANLKQAEAKLGPDHPDTLTSRNNLAELYRTAGRTAEAIALHEATLKQREAKLGPDDRHTLTSRNNLALANRDAGRMAEAIALYEANLKRLEAKLGPDHADTLTSRSNLANTYKSTGRTAEAIALHEATLERREAKLGPDHPDTLTSMNNLAAAYSQAGKLDRSLALFEATLKRREAKLGPDHTDTLTSRHNLAAAYLQAGKLDRSVVLFEATLKQREAKLGADHPETLRTQVNLGTNYLIAGRLEESIRQMEQAFDRARRRYGSMPAALAHVPAALADAYDRAGHHDKAEPILRDILAQAREQYGPADPRTVGAMAQLGTSLIQQRKWAEAEPVLRECLAIREKARPDDWSTFNTRSLLGGSLLGQGKYAEAEPLVVSGYEGLKARESKIPAPGKSRLPEAAERVVRLYEAWGKPEQAAARKARLGLTELPINPFSP